MSTLITINIPHQLGRAEARRRIEAGFAKFIQVVPGSSATGNERWERDRLTFRVAAMGQTIAGVIDVLDASISMQIELPGALGLLARSLEDRLKKAGQSLLTKD
jgi:hypothetical protein